MTPREVGGHGEKKFCADTEHDLAAHATPGDTLLFCRKCGYCFYAHGVAFYRGRPLPIQPEPRL